MSDDTQEPVFDAGPMAESAAYGAGNWIGEHISTAVESDHERAGEYFSVLMDAALRGAVAAIEGNDIELYETFWVYSDVQIAQLRNREFQKGYDQAKAESLFAAMMGTKPPKRRPIPGRTRVAVFERDAYRCVVCQSWEDLSLDHIHPVAKGGTNDIDNLQTMCRSCNSAKGVKVDE